MPTVLDTSVVIDALIEHRARHKDAVALVHLLERRGDVVLFPMHSFFEIVSAVACEKRITRAPPKTGELEGLPCKQRYIPIDNEFLRKYLFEPLRAGQFIDLKSGDMILVAVARREQANLITEDRKMAKVAQSLGVHVSTVSEALNDS